MRYMNLLTSHKLNSVDPYCPITHHCRHSSVIEVAAHYRGLYICYSAPLRHGFNGRRTGSCLVTYHIHCTRLAAVDHTPTLWTRLVYIVSHLSFSVAGPRLWNNLPTEIRRRDTSNTIVDCLRRFCSFRLRRIVTYLSAPDISTLTHSLTHSHCVINLGCHWCDLRVNL